MYNKNFKKLSKNLKKSITIKDYELLTSFIIEIDKYKNSNNSGLLSGYKIAEYILQKLRMIKLKKV